MCAQQEPLPRDKSVVFVYVVGGITGEDVAALRNHVRVHNRTSHGVGDAAQLHHVPMRVIVGGNGVYNKDRQFHSIFEQSFVEKKK